MVCRNQELIRGVAKFGVLDLDLFPFLLMIWAMAIYTMFCSYI
jgi:hypothetical protein